MDTKTVSSTPLTIVATLVALALALVMVAALFQAVTGGAHRYAQEKTTECVVGLEALGYDKADAEVGCANE